MITVQPARREDAETLLSLIAALADYEKLTPPDAGARARLIQDGWETTPPRFEGFIVRDDHRPVGYALIFPTYSTFLARPTLFIEDIFVLPDARRLGAGDAVFRHLCALAQARGCGRVEWACLNWNQLAIDFYEKRGGVHLDEWRSYRLTGDAIARIANGEARG